MERMILNIKDKDIAEIIEHIYSNAMGNPVLRDDTPTLTTMKPNSIVKNGTDVYIKFADGTGLKLTGVAM